MNKSAETHRGAGREVPMFPRMQNAGDSDAAWSSINRVRLAEGLEQYRAPSGKKKIIAAISMDLSSLLKVLIL
jgi:hypothetical protein